MFSGEQLKQFFVNVVLPIVTSVLTTWLFATVHIFNLFHISEGTVAAELTQLGVFAVTALITFLTGHHILTGKYTPSAKLAAGQPKTITINVPPKA